MSLNQLEAGKAWTLFLDRDGVINQRNFQGYITNSSEFIFLPYVLEALKSLSEKFGFIFIVTNQQGVGKGLMNQRNLDEVHRYMLDEMRQNQIKIDGIYVATNLRGETNDRRKPNPAMALEVKKDFPKVDFSKSIMVGDTTSDLQFGMNLGMKTVLVNSTEVVTVKPDLNVDNLKQFLNEIS